MFLEVIYAFCIFILITLITEVIVGIMTWVRDKKISQLEKKYNQKLVRTIDKETGEIETNVNARFLAKIMNSENQCDLNKAKCILNIMCWQFIITKIDLGFLFIMIFAIVLSFVAVFTKFSLRNLSKVTGISFVFGIVWALFERYFNSEVYGMLSDDLQNQVLSQLNLIKRYKKGDKYARSLVLELLSEDKENKN